MMPSHGGYQGTPLPADACHPMPWLYRAAGNLTQHERARSLPLKEVVEQSRYASMGRDPPTTGKRPPMKAAASGRCLPASDWLQSVGCSSSDAVVRSHPLSRRHTSTEALVLYLDVMGALHLVPALRVHGLPELPLLFHYLIVAVDEGVPHSLICRLRAGHMIAQRQLLQAAQEVVGYVLIGKAILLMIHASASPSPARGRHIMVVPDWPTIS